MKQHSSMLTAILAGLIIGLLLGYFFGAQQNTERVSMSESHIMYEDELLARDGAMQHAMEEMMFEFRGKSGEAYEEAFLRGMIVHHLGAIAMAEGLLAETQRPELVAMAHEIIEAQSREVETMLQWLSDWFPTR